MFCSSGGRQEGKGRKHYYTQEVAITFRVPTFPSSVAIWHAGNAPPAFPDLITTAQLTPGRRTQTTFVKVPAGSVVPACIHALLPPLTDIRDAKAPGGVDLIEAPIGSGRFYAVAFVDDIGKGFPNEHRFALATGIPTWPVPYPVGRPPQGIEALWLISAGSLGFVVPNITFNFANPFPGLAILVVAIYNDVFAFPTTIIDVTLPTSRYIAPQAIAGAVNCVTSISLFPLQPGYHAVGVRPPSGLGIIQVQLLFATNLYVGTLDNGINAAGAGVPALAAPGGQAHAVNLYVAAFGQVNAVGPFAYAPGFTSSGGDVTDVIGGNPCTLSLGTFVSPTFGAYPASMPGATAAAWSGIDNGFF